MQPIIDLLNTIFGRSDTVPLPPGQLGPPAPGRSAFGGSSAGMLRGPASITIYTGADPRAVIRAIRRYTGDNGGAPAGLATLRGA